MKRIFFTLGILGISFVAGCGGKDAGQNAAAIPKAEAQPQNAPQPLKPEPVKELPKPKPTNLIHAASIGNVNDVKVFLRNEPETLKQPNDIGMYPIHLAASKGHSEVIQILLKAGADVNTPNTKVLGTPLQYAAAAGRVDAVRTLLDEKANVNATDGTGRTPLMWAATNGHRQVVELLLTHGADANQKTRAGWTALKYAEQQKHPEIAELLRKQTPAAP